MSLLWLISACECHVKFKLGTYVDIIAFQACKAVYPMRCGSVGTSVVSVGGCCVQNENLGDADTTSSRDFPGFLRAFGIAYLQSRFRCRSMYRSLVLIYSKDRDHTLTATY